MKTKMFILIWVFSVCAYAQQIKGKIIKVSDGDTVTLLTDNNEQIRVRFYGIDAPERKQDFGQKARKFVNDLCYGKIVIVEDKGIDKYKRTIGIVYINGININEALLANGLAWHYKFFSNSQKYASIEKEARLKKLNIWSMPDPVAPWYFRKNTR